MTGAGGNGAFPAAMAAASMWRLRKITFMAKLMLITVNATPNIHPLMLPPSALTSAFVASNQDALVDPASRNRVS